MVSAMYFRHVFSALLLLMLFCSGAIAQQKITTLTGKTFTGKITKIADGKIAGEGFDEIKLANVVSIATSNTAKASAAKYAVRLVSGGTIQVSKFSVADGELSVKTEFGEYKLGVASVRAILFRPLQVGPAVKNAIKKPLKNNDQVVAESSQGPRTAQGLVEEINDEKVVFNYKGTSRTIPRSKVIAVVMANLQEKKLKGSVATVTFKDSSTAVGTLRSLTDGKMTIGLLSGTTLNVPFADVVSVNIRNDRLTYLSDLEPTDSEHNSIVAPKRAIAKDKNFDGKPLSLTWGANKKTQTFPRGIVAHSYSRIVYSNDGFQRFVTTCGIDSTITGNGHCIVTIRGDGIKLWNGEIAASSDPSEIDIDIEDYKSIEIVIDYGKHLDMGDHVIFGNARLLKTK